MSFEIRNPKGKVINPGDLDQEACDFWLIARDSRHYAHPPLEDKWTNSWHANIGFAIESPTGFSKGWEEVKATLWTMQARDLYKVIMDIPNESIEVNSDLLNQLGQIRAFLRPYFDLINYWESKGYIPIKTG